MAGVDERMATIKSERVIRPLRPKEDGGGCVKGTAFQKSGVMSDNLDRLLRRKRKGGGQGNDGDVSHPRQDCTSGSEHSNAFHRPRASPCSIK